MIDPSAGGADPDPLRAIKSRRLPSEAEGHLAQLTQETRGQDVAYLSTPITTGPRYLAWKRQHRDDPVASRVTAERELKAEVMAQNLQAVEPLRARIRRHWPQVVLIDPTRFEEAGWQQGDYHRYWIEVIDRFPSRVVFADGWQYSTGCALEYAFAVEKRLDLKDADLRDLDAAHSHLLLTRAAQELAAVGLDTRAIEEARAAASKSGPVTPPPRGRPAKDERLADLGRHSNVAIFGSFEPYTAAPRHFVSRALQGEPGTLHATVGRLMEESREKSLNVRSFREGESKSSPFIYGIRSVEEVVDHVMQLSASGFYTIVNETLDVHDGGVSGVNLGDVVEFAPDTTPRGVESGTMAQMSTDMAGSVLSTVYGFPVRFAASPEERIEFSVHPRSVGNRQGHVITWEIEDVPASRLTARVNWPNNFSRMIGDKTFGLLVADHLGANVPRLTALPRRIAPFSFGRPTGSGEWWMRTAPAERQPGRFTTTYGWVDPYKLLSAEDSAGEVATVLAQEAVPAVFSGASAPLSDGRNEIEGVPGEGDAFMLGGAPASKIPAAVASKVDRILRTLSETLGPVSAEWAFDGELVWILQLHRADPLDEGVLSPGDAEEWFDYRPSDGLNALRTMIGEVEGRSVGVRVTEPIGITSHVGDLLRKHRIPARLSVAGNRANGARS